MTSPYLTKKVRELAEAKKDLKAKGKEIADLQAQLGAAQNLAAPRLGIFRNVMHKFRGRVRS